MNIEKVNHILGKAVNRLLIEENDALQQVVERAEVGGDDDDALKKNKDQAGEDLED